MRNPALRFRLSIFHLVFSTFFFFILAQWAVHSAFASDDLPAGPPAGRTGRQGLYFLHTDHLGSTRVVTDQGGNQVASYDYYPYGAINNQQLSINNQDIERLYTNQIFDQTADLYFYNARYYSPEMGTFVSADPVEGRNRYAYVSGNPINMLDLTGNQGEIVATQVVGIKTLVSNYFPEMPAASQLYLGYVPPTQSVPLEIVGRSFSLTKPIRLQSYYINPETDIRLREFLERGVEAVNRRQAEEGGSRLVYMTEYVNENVPAEGLSVFKHLKGIFSSKGTPLGDFVEGGICPEKALLEYLLIKEIYPDLEVRLVKGAYGTRVSRKPQGLGEALLYYPRKIVSILPFLPETRGVGHVFLEVNLEDGTQFVVDPTKLVVEDWPRAEILYGGIDVSRYLTFSFEEE